jgi:hypothetical protein
MISKELSLEMDKIQEELRALLKNDSIVLREEATTSMLIEKFNFTVEFMPRRSMLQLHDEKWMERKAAGVVMVPADDDAGCEFLRKRNVAIMALWKLREEAKLSEEAAK